MEYYKILTLVKVIYFVLNIFCFLQKANSLQAETSQIKNNMSSKNKFSIQKSQNINPIEIEYEMSNLDNNYFVISTKDGFLHLYKKLDPKKKIWSVNLGEELIRTNIIRKNIIDENKVLIPMDGKLFIVTNEPDIQFEEFAIPITDLVNKAPFSLYFMPNYLFIGNKLSNLITIDIESGNIVQNEFSFNKKKNNNNIINVFRDDYTLICLKNNEQVWNTTVSDIVIVKEGSSNEILASNDYMNNFNNFEIGINQNDIISIHDYDTHKRFPVKIYEQNHAMKTTDTSFFGRYDDGYFFYSEWDYDDEKFKKLMNNFGNDKKNKKKISFLYKLRYSIMKIYQNITMFYFDILIFLTFVLLVYQIIINFIKNNKNVLKNVKQNCSNNIKDSIKVEQKKTEENINNNAKQRNTEIKNDTIQIPKINNSQIIKEKIEKTKIEEEEDKKLIETNSINTNIHNEVSPFKQGNIIQSNGIWDSSNSESSDSSSDLISQTFIKTKQTENLKNKNIQLSNNNNNNYKYNNSKIEENETKEKTESISKKDNVYISRGTTRLERDFKEFEKLGKGGFGIVLKARHKIDDKINAIKIVKLENLNEKNVIREAQTMKGIHSEHIVEYKSCWFDASLGSLEYLVNDSESEEEEVEFNNDISKSKSFSKLNGKNYSKHLKKIDENEDEDKDDISNLLNYQRSNYYNNVINNENENFKNNINNINESFNYKSSSHSHISNEPSIVFCDNENNNNKLCDIIFGDENENSTQYGMNNIIFEDEKSISNNNELKNNSGNSKRYNHAILKKENYSSQNLKYNSMIFDSNLSQKSSISSNKDIFIRKRFKSKTDLVNYPYLLNLCDDNYIAKKIYEEPLSDTERSGNKNKKNKKKQKMKVNLDFRDDTSKSLTRQSKISLKEIPQLKTYFFIQMEFCEGLTLRQYIDNNVEKGLSENTIFIFTYQLLKSLKKIHEHNIIHRDIKPDNIFVINNHSIKIGDFGLATEMKEIKKDKGSKNNLLIPHNKKSSNSLIKGYNESCLEGTPIYISPEQLERKAIDGKVDIYALGLVLYEMCGCFLTQMERRKSLENLKLNRIIVDKVKDKYSIQSKLILKMTERNARIRPNADDVLKSEEFLEWKALRKKMVLDM